MLFEVKRSKSLRTPDGIAWSAELWADGHRAAVVSNDGRGGPDFVRWLDATLRASVEAHAGDVAAMVGKLCDEQETLRRFARLSRANVVFRKPSGEVRAIPTRGARDSVLAYIGKQYPGSQVFNATTKGWE